MDPSPAAFKQTAQKVGKSLLAVCQGSQRNISVLGPWIHEILPWIYDIRNPIKKKTTTLTFKAQRAQTSNYLLKWLCEPSEFAQSWWYTILQSLKPAFSHLNIGRAPKGKFIFQPLNFRGYVSLREGSSIIIFNKHDHVYIIAIFNISMIYIVFTLSILTTIWSHRAAFHTPCKVSTIIYLYKSFPSPNDILDY